MIEFDNLTDEQRSCIPDVRFELIPIKNLVSSQDYQRDLKEGHITDTDRIGDRIARILGVPGDCELVCILPVGVAETEPTGPKKQPFEERAWFNGYGKPVDT